MEKTSGEVELDDASFGRAESDEVGKEEGETPLVYRLGAELQFQEAVNYLAELEDALNSAFIEFKGEQLPLKGALKHKEVIRGHLKKAMGKDRREKVIDETSGMFARLNPSFSDDWDVPKLRAALKPRQRKLVFIEAINHSALNELIKTGAVSRAALEVAGAVRKRLRSVALLVRPIKDDKVGG